MFQLHSVTGRIFIGLVSILFLSLIGWALTQIYYLPFGAFFGLGTILLFVLMGLTLGLVGIFDRHPIFGFKMHWWIRGPVVGFLFTLAYILLSYDSIVALLQSPLLSWMGFYSPFWVLIDGTLIGLLIGWAETHFAGEGSELPLQ